MAQESKKSIWSVVPDEWRTEAPQVQEQPAPAEPLPLPRPEPPAAEAEPPAPKPSAITRRRQEREEFRQFERNNDNNMKNAAEHTKKAYLLEKLGNRRDLTVLAVLLLVVVLAVAVLLICFSQMSSQRLHRLIEQENYSLAYHELVELHEKGDNVDALVYTFAEQCVQDSEYKRAVASLELLSQDAVEQPEFFRMLVQALLEHGKTSRAEDVLSFMHEHSDGLSAVADALQEEFFAGKE